MPDIDETYALARRHLAAKNLPEAERLFRAVIETEPARAEAHLSLGLTFGMRDRFHEAEPCFREAARLRPDMPEAFNNLGLILGELDRGEEAIAMCREAIRLRPNYAKAWNNLGLVHALQGNYSEAISCYERTLAMEAEHPHAHANRALAWLATGNYERGWPEYEWRWKCPEFTPRPFRQPLWDGSALAGRTILLHNDLGYGDFFQFIRYAPLLKEKGGRVIVECPARLMPVLSRCPGVDSLAAAGSPLPEFDVHLPVLSLPAVFRTTVDTVPANVPYLFADPELVEKWRRDLSRLPGFKVGVAWHPDTAHARSRYRVIPLRAFEPLARVEGVTLVSLQKGPGIEQLHEVAPQFQVATLDHVDEEAGAFADTAAIMRNLDLIVSTDSALVHLAGGLGVRAWLPLWHVADWRWLLDRDDSPWYPTVRLFRQDASRSWEELFEKLAEELKKVL